MATLFQPYVQIRPRWENEDYMLNSAIQNLSGIGDTIRKNKYIDWYKNQQEKENRLKEIELALKLSSTDNGSLFGTSESYPPTTGYTPQDYFSSIGYESENPVLEASRPGIFEKIRQWQKDGYPKQYSMGSTGIPQTREDALGWLGKLPGNKFESGYKWFQSAFPENKSKEQLPNYSNIDDLRKEYLNLPEVKDYKLVSTNINAMDSLLKSALAGDMKNKAALDQGLITMYNKLTDPNSVVRESEYARTPENLPFVNRISGAIQKVQEGGAGLTDEDRKALVIGAKIIGNERGKSYATTKNQYSSMAQRRGYDPIEIIGTSPIFSPYKVSGSPTSQETIEVITSDGKRQTIFRKNLQEAIKRDPGLRY